ncbi:MAG: FecR domain-containing protein [Bacteriovoracaceae bacterium]|nr:FecR domain-containing protein [Bacteriovoracaceae bacterium]
MNLKSLTTLFIILFSNSLLAQDHAGVIVKIKGKSELFTQPSKTLSAGQTQKVLFEGLYYSVEPIKLGTKVTPGSVVRTGADAKLRLVYKNGDQVTVGPATSYQIIVGAKKTEDEKSSIKLMYGAIRSVVSKEGPRSGMNVKTRTAAMGVRGTDFFISQRGSSGNTRVAVLRGEVEVKPKDKNDVLNVKSGFTAAVVENKNDIKAEVKQTTQQELISIQKDSLIKTSEAEVDSASDAVKAEIAQLEKKATDVTLNDIKRYDEKLYNKLKTVAVKSVDELNTLSVKKIFKDAPKNQGKISSEDLENLEMDAYEEFFKVQN